MKRPYVIAATAAALGLAAGGFLMPDFSSASLTAQQVHLQPGQVARVACSGAHLTVYRVSPTVLRDRCHAATTPPPSSTEPPPSSTPPPPPVGVTKVLTIIEENHSLAEMQAQMPYLNGLAQQYSYAKDWTAVSHPSEPNYLAIAGGSTFGVTDDADPATNAPKVGQAQSVFDQAIAAGDTAKTYSEGMPSNCALTNTGGVKYAVKHNPWAYFTAGRADCNRYDVPLTPLASDASAGNLPNVGMVVPNLCNDAHDCSLTVADNWLKANLPAVLNGPDFTSGRLAIVVTADEDDHSQGNKVLTVVMHQGTLHRVVTTALTHYSLTRFYAQVVGVQPLLNGATAPDMKSAFGL